jgi:hypothetical protein
LGLFKIVLTLIKSHGHWQIEVEHDAQAAELTEAIQKNVEAAIGDMVIQPQGIRWFFQQKQTHLNGEGVNPEFEDEKVEKGKTEKASVGLYPGSGVSLREILLAYLLIRIILDLDDGRRIVHDP